MATPQSVYTLDARGTVYITCGWCGQPEQLSRSGKIRLGRWRYVDEVQVDKRGVRTEIRHWFVTMQQVDGCARCVSEQQTQELHPPRNRRGEAMKVFYEVKR